MNILHNKLLKTTNLLGLLAGTAFLAFAPVLWNEFLDWDDDTNFLENPHFRGLGWEQVRWAFTTHWLGAYQPFAWILFGVEYALWKLNPWGFHFTSILLHIAITVTIWSLAVMLLKRDAAGSAELARSPAPLGVAALAALLFAVHPLRVETVAWASAQGYLPGTLLALLATAVYVRAIESQGWLRIVWLTVGVLAFVGSLLSHGLALGLPLALLALHVGFLRRPRSRSEMLRAVRSIVLFIPITLIFVVVVYRSKEDRMVGHAGTPELIGSGLASACYSSWFYLVKTIVPIGLHAHYQGPGPLRVENVGLALACLATAVAAAALPRVARGLPGLAAAILGCLVLLAPTSGIVHYGSEVVADRYSYLPSIPLILALAVALGRLDASWRKGAAGALLLAIPVLAALTREQCRVWHDSEHFLSYLLKAGGDGEGDGLVHLKLGLVTARQPGRLAEARAQVEQAVRLNPTNPRFRHNLGYLLAREGRTDDAIAEYLEASRLDLEYPLPRRALGSLFFQQGRFEQARVHYGAVVRLEPRSAPARCDLGLVLERTGDLNAAEAQFRTALELDARSALAHQELGLILAARNQRAEARTHLDRALQIQPGLAAARRGLEALDLAPPAEGR